MSQLELPLFGIKPLPYHSNEVEHKEWIVKVEIVDGKDTDLHIDKPVYEIHLADVREESNI
jgi:hypothetical protein